MADIVLRGYAECLDKKMKGDPGFIMISGSTLYHFENELDEKPQTVIELAANEFSQDGNVISIKYTNAKGKPDELNLRHRFQSMTDRWMVVFNEAKSKPHGDLPADQGQHEAVKTGISYRLKKATASKLANTKAAGSAIGAVDEEIGKILKALNSLVSVYADKDTAVWVQKSITKIVAKTAVEWDRKTLVFKDLMPLDTPLRAAFNGLDKLFQWYKRRPVAAFAEQFKAVEQQLFEAGTAIQRIMTPYLHAKNVMMIQDFVAFIAPASFWSTLWDKEDPDGSIERSLFDLVHAMSRYTQMHFN